MERLKERGKERLRERERERERHKEVWIARQIDECIEKSNPRPVYLYL